MRAMAEEALELLRQIAADIKAVRQLTEAAAREDPMNLRWSGQSAKPGYLDPDYVGGLNNTRRGE